MKVHIRTYTYVCSRTTAKYEGQDKLQENTHTHTHTHTHIHIYIYMFVSIYTYEYLHTHICRQTTGKCARYLYIHMNVYIHIYAGKLEVSVRVGLDI